MSNSEDSDDNINPLQSIEGREYVIGMIRILYF